MDRIVLSLIVAFVACAGCAADLLTPTTEGRTAQAPTEEPPTGTPLSVEEPTAPPAWKSYTNAAYGFSLQHPPGWDLLDGRNFVRMRKDGVSLVVGFRHASEDPNVCCRELLPEGEVVEAGTITCAGESVAKALLTCDGKTKAVIYEGTREIVVDELRFLFYLEDFSVDYEAASIPGDVVEQVDKVVGSLVTFSPAMDFETERAEVTDQVAATEVVSPSPTYQAQTPTPMPTATTGVAEIESRGANVRSGPGLDYGLKGFLEEGERAAITGRYGEWWRIAQGEGSAWVYDGVARAIGAEDVPEVDTIPTVVPPSPAVIPTAAAPSEIDEARWIDVDLSEQRLRAYKDGEVVRTTLVSTGLARTPTPSGQFRIWIKLRYDDMSGPDYYLEDVPYAMYFYQGYGLHGTYWHENFGQRMSHGCVNLPTAEAEWVFDFVDVGTLVNVHD